MATISDIVKPVLFEVAILVGFVAWALLGLWVDAFLGLRMILAWSYSYVGVVPLLGGVALRFWASWTIFNTGNGTPLYTRPAKALVTTGPYRLIRNPLYLGGLLIYLGIIIVIPSLFLAILGLIGLPITFIGIVREEKGLETRFGEDYRRYKQRVPGWIPDLREPNLNRPGSAPDTVLLTVSGDHLRVSYLDKNFHQATSHSSLSRCNLSRSNQHDPLDSSGLNFNR